MSTIRICPSILAADLLTLREQVQAAERGADRFQVDVMDGTFVPNISFGFPPEVRYILCQSRTDGTCER